VVRRVFPFVTALPFRDNFALTVNPESLSCTASCELATFDEEARLVTVNADWFSDS
jgi:hypothetical protein